MTHRRKIMNLSVKEALQGTCDLISNPSNWIARNYALNGAGDSVEPWRPCAVAWCAEGALAKVCGITSWSEENETYKQASNILDKVCDKLYHEGIICVNDYEGYENILEVFHIAIDIMEAE
jgi:hypothetical protein